MTKEELFLWKFICVLRNSDYIPVWEKSLCELWTKNNLENQLTAQVFLSFSLFSVLLVRFNVYDKHIKKEI